MPKAADRIEDLRLAWERDLERTFAKGYGARPSIPDPGARDPRVRLEATMAERVHRIARDAAERLGCTEPFDLYQTPNARSHLSAQALLSERPFAVRLIGPVASVLDDASLASLIGHELGHWMALGPRANPPSILLESWERGALPRVTRFCTLAAEITADRFALIAAGGELEAAVRLDVALATFDSPRALGLRELDYLEELRQRIECCGDDVLVDERGYPTSAFRLYATWLFWRSDVHRDLTGVGPGDRAIRDVDAVLQKMCTERLPEPPCEVRSVKAARASAPGPTVPASVPLAGHVRAATSSVASTLGRLFSSIDVGRRRVANTDEDDATISALYHDDIDDLEGRFRELESKFVHDMPAPTPEHIDDLEARFRELEERERNAK